MKPRAGSKALIREINEALVLDVVRTQSPVSRATITGQTGLSAASVTGITGMLIQSGLLVETETPIGAIAERLGFENRCAFARLYHGHDGVPASVYRRDARRVARTRRTTTALQTAAAPPA